MNITELENLLKNTDSVPVQNQIKAQIQKLQLQQSAKQGDDVANALLVLKDAIDTFKTTSPSGTSTSNVSLSKQEVDKILNDALKNRKIGIEDLSAEIKSYLSSAVKVSLIPTEPTAYAKVSSTEIDMATLDMPLFQKILSDKVAMNNVYLFGGAGTGKTYIAQEMAKFLGYQFVILNCNQYTSPLEIIGGQTIEGYQLGKLERAWGNFDEKGNPSGFAGSVLCIDEMPKIDPNTAGLLNDALAKVKDYSSNPNDKDNPIPPMIENGKGEKIQKQPLLIIATGNLKLNEVSTEYEANFKQDLSLQDRFVGSTYEVVVDYENEWNSMMKGFAFIYIPLIKLRETIEEERWTPFAFVSRRIMTSLKATYITYRLAMKKSLDPTIQSALKTPKTLIDGVNSFLNLFKEDQIDELKNAMDYDNFIKICKQKDKMDIDNLDTPEELKEVKRLIDENKQKIKNKIA